MLKTFKDIVDLTKKRINETTTDEQVDTMVKEAVNHAYLYELSKLDPVITKTMCPAVNGSAVLPEDLEEIISVSPDLAYGERQLGRYLLSDRNITFTIVYKAIPEPLVNDDDVPELQSKYFYLLSTYACYAYFTYRKKSEAANLFMSEYLLQRNAIKPSDFGAEYEVRNTKGW